MNREGKLNRYKLNISINRTIRYLNESVLCFFFDGPFYKAIALPTITIAIVVALKGDSEKITVTFC